MGNSNLKYDLERFNKLVRTFSSGESSLKSLFFGGKKVVFNGMLYELSELFVKEGGRIDYLPLIELIWEGSYKKIPVPTKSASFLKKISYELVGFHELPDKSKNKLLKENIRLRVYRYKRKINLQK